MLLHLCELELAADSTEIMAKEGDIFHKTQEIRATGHGSCLDIRNEREGEANDDINYSG